MLYERILVGTDGSPTAAKAVDRAVSVAEMSGAPLTILHVGSGPKAQAIAAQAAARYVNSDVDITTEVRQGDPAAVLVDLADSGGYSLLVVGNKGMAGPARFLIGSVPNKVSHHARCSLLIVHTT